MYRKIAGAAAVCYLALIASGAFAQDQSAGRRERLRKLAETGAGIAARVAEEAGDRAEAVHGNVINLQGKPGAKSKEVNVGGLVLIRVPDSGSRPPQGIKADGGKQFIKLGQVRGMKELKGEPQMGSGYTLILLTPAKEGEATINVSFTANDGGGVKKNLQYKVNVTAAEAHGADDAESN